MARKERSSDASDLSSSALSYSEIDNQSQWARSQIGGIRFKTNPIKRCAKNVELFQNEKAIIERGKHFPFNQFTTRSKLQKEVEPVKDLLGQRLERCWPSKTSLHRESVSFLFVVACACVVNVSCAPVDTYTLVHWLPSSYITGAPPCADLAQQSGSYKALCCCFVQTTAGTSQRRSRDSVAVRTS